LDVDYAGEGDVEVDSSIFLTSKSRKRVGPFSELWKDGMREPLFWDICC
jgi:hypothetical protein